MACSAFKENVKAAALWDPEEGQKRIKHSVYSFFFLEFRQSLADVIQPPFGAVYITSDMSGEHPV